MNALQKTLFFCLGAFLVLWLTSPGLYSLYVNAMNNVHDAPLAEMVCVQLQLAQLSASASEKKEETNGVKTVSHNDSPTVEQIYEKTLAELKTESNPQHPLQRQVLENYLEYLRLNKREVEASAIQAKIDDLVRRSQATK